MASPTTRTTSSIEQILPNSQQAEGAVLGTILLDTSIPNSSLAAVSEIIKSDDFFSADNQRIFRTMHAIDGLQQPIDLVTLNDKLDSLGGHNSSLAAYAAHLVDGAYRVPNIRHYAGIVREKAILRTLAHKFYNCQQRALEAGETAEHILSTFAEDVREIVNANTKPRLVAVSADTFLQMDFAPLDFIVEPLLTVKGRAMIYSPRGAGKTQVAMQIAHCVATAQNNCFVWNVPKRRRVVYVDGEMHAAMLQQRVRDIAAMNYTEPCYGEYLNIITRDTQKDVLPHINSKPGRDQIEAHLQSGTLLILDNLSALSPSSDEKETEDWALIEEWFSRITWQGVSVLFVHHSGKGGDQRGTSKREDLLDSVVRLNIPHEHRQEDGMLVEVHITKLRCKVAKAIYAQPFEARIGTDERGQQIWVTRQLRELLRERAREMLADGMKSGDVVLETGLSRWAVARIAKGLKFGPGAERGEL